MVARSPPKQQPRKLMVAPLNPTRIRETLNKVDQCMARLQELQYTVTGGNKLVAGVNLSPRSTRGYLKASLRCKQESVRSKGAKRSPTGKLPSANAGEWRRMSLPAMLLGETVGEILQASKFAKDIVETFSKPADLNYEPKTPVTVRREQRISNDDNAAGGIESRRKREKQHVLRIVRAESNTPAIRRARSKINFKNPSPERVELEKENRQGRYSANRVSPRHRPWAKKAVLFPNPLFNSPPAASKHRRFCSTKSPVIVKQIRAKHQIQSPPRKFVIKSPPSAKSKFQVKIKSPVAVAKLSPPRVAVAKLSPPRAGGRRGRSPLKMVATATATAGKLRRSLSPARLASRLMSPLRRSDAGGGVVSGWKQRPIVPAMRYPSPRV